MVDYNATEMLGLTENDLQVYSAYLKRGDATPAEIARVIGMDKSSAYRAVDNLEKLNLLIKNPKKKGTTYQAANPDALREIYVSKKGILDTMIEGLKEQIQTSQRNTFIVVEYGLDALRNRMTESLNSKEKLIREKFSNKFRFFDDSKHVRFVVNYAKERVENGIQINVLEEHDWKTDNRFEDVMVDLKKYLKQIRLLPQDIIFGENSLRIWDDTINIVSEDENRNFIVVTIKDKYVTQMFKVMFDFMWLRSEPIN